MKRVILALIRFIMVPINKRIDKETSRYLIELAVKKFHGKLNTDLGLDSYLILDNILHHEIWGISENYTTGSYNYNEFPKVKIYTDAVSRNADSKRFDMLIEAVRSLSVLMRNIYQHHNDSVFNSYRSKDSEKDAKKFADAFVYRHLLSITLLAFRYRKYKFSIE